ncbi:MAG: D-alanyl-D-alanine carboxypeptidase [Acidobacteriota bacterium]|nr:MAG: D-alanyl-D-alanine carboxypeptidase [Acidobacteriota bacterium]
MIKRAIVVSSAFLLCASVSAISVSGQTSRPPLLQDIKIAKEEPIPGPTPLVKKTGSSSPTSAPPGLAVSRRTSVAALAEIDIPGNSGIIIESERGTLVFESYPDEAFNPASNVKVATAYAVLKTFGPDFRFITGVWTDGKVDLETATLTGNLYVSGRDPIFGYEHGMAIANELNRLGIRKIEGNVFVTGNFVMNYNGSASRSGYTLINTMDGGKRGASANRAWDSYLMNSGKFKPGLVVPSVTTTGSVDVSGIPGGAKLLFSHESAPMREILKVTLSYSNNFLSEKLGEMLGGTPAVERIVRRDIGASEEQFSLQTSSGLGINRVTARAQLALLKRTKKLLEGHEMKLSDILPVAGIDDGTLRGRFGGDLYAGSVVGKTGTLRRTDNGVSSLSGEFVTNQGKFLFVIFNQRGGVGRFRNFQNLLIPLAQGALGGAKPMAYAPVHMERRLAKTRIKYPERSRISLDEE